MEVLGFAVRRFSELVWSEVRRAGSLTDYRFTEDLPTFVRTVSLSAAPKVGRFSNRSHCDSRSRTKFENLTGQESASVVCCMPETGCKLVLRFSQQRTYSLIRNHPRNLRKRRSPPSRLENRRYWTFQSARSATTSSRAQDSGVCKARYARSHSSRHCEGN